MIVLGLNGSPRRKVKIADVKQHSQPDDCWTVLHGRVYNIAPYLRFHPGGAFPAIPVVRTGGRAGLLGWMQGKAFVPFCLSCTGVCVAIGRGCRGRQ